MTTQGQDWKGPGLHSPCHPCLLPYQVIPATHGRGDDDSCPRPTYSGSSDHYSIMGARDIQQIRARQGVGQQNPASQGPKGACLGRVYDSKEHFFHCKLYLTFHRTLLPLVFGVYEKNLYLTSRPGKHLCLCCYAVPYLSISI